MTENEAIKTLEYTKRSLGMPDQGDIWKPNRETIAIDIAIQALEEIQQYWAIGTVEEIKKKMEELERWHTDKVNEKIKNPFAYTSTLICHNCDHKDEYIEEIEAELEEFKSIGMVDECRAAVERMKLRSQICI